MDVKKLDPTARVLIVEDDYTYLSFWKRFLENLGITNYRLVTNPYEAKELIVKDEYRLIISDINMHGMNGYELAKLASTLHTDCAIILTTAYSANLSRFDIGHCPFHLLYKPFSNLEELGKLIRHLIAGDASFDDVSEDSFSENEDYPLVTEWKL